MAGQKSQAIDEEYRETQRLTYRNKLDADGGVTLVYDGQHFNLALGDYGEIDSVRAAMETKAAFLPVIDRAVEQVFPMLGAQMKREWSQMMTAKAPKAIGA
jgi:hypothetical protein